MSRDNVTPFRPRPKRPPARPAGEGLGLKTHRGKAVLVQALTLVTFILNVVFPTQPLSFIVLAVGIAGVAIAASNRLAGMPWAQTHHEHALRTIVIGFAVSVLASLLALLGPLGGIGFYVSIAVLIWAALRAGVGLVFAILRKPIRRPTGLLF